MDFATEIIKGLESLPLLSSTAHHLRQTADAITQTAVAQHGQIDEAIRLIRQCRESGGTVYVAGNGGSSATAAHFVNDLVKAAGCRAVDLMANTALFTAYCNDESYDHALYHLANRFVRKGDIVFCISVSGTSTNVVMLAGVKTARPYAPPIICLGSLRNEGVQNTRFYADVFIEAQSEDMAISEDVHLAVCHAIVKGLQE